MSSRGRPPTGRPPEPAGADADAAVIARSRREPECFAALYDRHFAGIHRYLTARLGRDAADDLAAETFCVAFRKRAGFDAARGAVRPWPYGIATNLAAQHRRDEGRRYDLLARAAAGGPGGPDDVADRVADRVTAQDLRPRIAGAVAGLPDGDRDVLLLVAVAGLGYAEAAAALGIPGGTVGSRLNRARRKVRLALGGIDPARIVEEDPRG
ncbi:RNA polymerase sigma factor [Actinomadura sp. PM05-2]|uniref:RNA polymerase sigma factor n=1 Tax=Actinomadura parmotrematis TaxID=2864039 RepID=A0ABS7FNJ1_9ACTN|nr:RNA polymerase sigma factor [Actinomadura parmotrematis]